MTDESTQNIGPFLETLFCIALFVGSFTMHYAAIESNRELNKSLKVIALLLLIFGQNLKILFLDLCKPVNIFQEK